MNFKIIIILSLVILSIIIFAQNTQVISFQFLFWELTMSRIILLLFTMVIGIIIGYIVATVQKRTH